MEGSARPLALTDLLCTLLAGLLWYVRPDVGAWPLLLILVGVVMRHFVEPRPVFEVTGLDAAVALFTLSAGIGLLIAYNWEAALVRFYLILAAVALYGALVRTPALVRIGRHAIAPVAVFLALLPTALAAYFILTTDYEQSLGKLPLLDGLLRWVVTWLPALPFDHMNPNVAGGILAALLPLQVKALWGRKERYWLLPVSVAGLVLSASRGAWLAVAVVGAVWFVMVAARSRRRLLTAAAGATAIALIVLAVLVVPTIFAQGGDRPPQASAPAPAAATETGGAGAVEQTPVLPAEVPSTAAGRTALFGNALGLAWDYALTGLGLDGFQMAFSSYVLLLHVGHTNHSHNIFLDVWLGQGLLGLTALIWLFVAAAVALRRILRLGDQEGRLWALAAAASAAVIALNGLVNDSLYASQGVLFLLIPFAILAREQSNALWRAQEDPATVTDLLAGRPGLVLGVACVVTLLISLLPPVRSQIQANLGALAQTRAELAIYDWPQWSIQDELRRAPGLGLEPAITRYEKALALDDSNATANRRLGQIAFSRGDYNRAGELLAAAYRSNYTNRATRQLYGEWLAIHGRPQEAAALWRTIDMGQGQLAARTWWFESIGEPEHAAALRLAASMVH